jgi:hypothetical protein
MVARLLYDGSDISFEYLNGQLREGEVLVVVYRDNSTKLRRARIITDQASYSSVTREAICRHYDGFCWYASDTGSVNPCDYRPPITVGG